MDYNPAPNLNIIPNVQMITYGDPEVTTNTKPDADQIIRLTVAYGF